VEEGSRRSDFTAGRGEHRPFVIGRIVCDDGRGVADDGQFHDVIIVRIGQVGTPNAPNPDPFADGREILHSLAAFGGRERALVSGAVGAPRDVQVFIPQLVPH